MADGATIASTGLSPVIAGGLPRYDPLSESNERTKRWTIALLSIGLHIALLALFWDAIIGAVFEKEEIVTVRVFEPQPVKPEPKLKRKVLAHRVLNANVTRFKQTAQPQIVEVSEIQRLDSVRKVEVKKTQQVRAPKLIKQRTIQTKTASVFSERPVAQPKALRKPSKVSVTRTQASKPTTGPRKLEAAGPVTNPQAAEVTAPYVARGVIADNAIDGDMTGAAIPELEVGDSSALIDGTGPRGALVGQEKDCMSDPVCREYLELIRRRVYARWAVPLELGGGQVSLRFRLDRGGSAHDVEAVRMTNDDLGRTASRAFQHASPFPPPPPSIHYIVNKPMRLIFTTNVSER